MYETKQPTPLISILTRITKYTWMFNHPSHTLPIKKCSPKSDRHVAEKQELKDRQTDKQTFTKIPNDKVGCYAMNINLKKKKAKEKIKWIREMNEKWEIKNLKSWQPKWKKRHGGGRQNEKHQQTSSQTIFLPYKTQRLFA